ncbi:MAG: hypothetical protein WCL07_04185 [bacterium]
MLANQEQSTKITIPPGKMEAPTNFDGSHTRVIKRVGNLELEGIHQNGGGDCVPATIINTLSILGVDVRNMFVESVKQNIFQTAQKIDNRFDNSVLASNGSAEMRDMVNVVADYFDKPTEQADILNVNGVGLSERGAQAQALNLLDLLNDTSRYPEAIMMMGMVYRPGMAATDSSRHATALYFNRQGSPDNCYVLIDPMSPEVFNQMGIEEVTKYIGTRMLGQRARDNFFYLPPGHLKPAFLKQGYYSSTVLQ